MITVCEYDVLQTDSWQEFHQIRCHCSNRWTE